MKIMTRNELNHPDMVVCDDDELKCYHDFFNMVDANVRAGMSTFEAKLEALARARIYYASLDSYANREFWGWLMVTRRDK